MDFSCSSRNLLAEIVSAFLDRYGNKDGYQAVRMDQERELGESGGFAAAVTDANDSLQLTGANAPDQNGEAERLNRTFENTVKALLLWLACPFGSGPLRSCMPPTSKIDGGIAQSRQHPTRPFMSVNPT